MVMGTPVLVGVAQFSERFSDPAYEALSPVAIAERAASLALADADIPAERLDVIACCRQFDASVPGMPSLLGRPDSFPRALANRLGADKARTRYATAGGHSPQQLVTELAGEIAAGSIRVALVSAAEAISTVLHLAGQSERPDLTEVTGAGDQVRDEERGVGLEGILAATQVVHQLTDAPTQYALFENARRARLGMTRAEQAADIGRWFAPFTEVAAANPHAAVRAASTGVELTTVTAENRVIADPYPKAVVAREKVNQAAAVVITSEEVATELGIPRSQWVYLRGHSDLHDRELTRRPDLSRSLPAVAAVDAALEMAGIGLDQVTAFDFYSCFPIAVSAVADELGLSSADPRRLTVTGGLPFFGGPGNGYSLHPIVEMVEGCRRDPAAWGLVGANGGMLSKYSVGVYSAERGPWLEGDDARRQAELDAPDDVPVTLHPDGWATVETWTVKNGGTLAVVIGRTEAGERFVANDFAADDEVRALLLGEDGPGARVFVRALREGNRVTLTRERMDELAPVAGVGIADRYDNLDVSVADGLLEIRITGTDGDHVLPEAAHHELADVFDAFEADPSLRVAILSGADERGWWSDPVTLPAFAIARSLPPTGVAGLVGRTLTKPVIAAVDGNALGSAFEAALACTLLVVAEGGRLGLPQARTGVAPAAGGLSRLPRLLPPQVARRMILTGLPIDAAEAERWGLVAEVAARGGALAAARELAAEVLACAPLAVQRSLAVMAADEAGEDVTELSADTYDALLVTSDAAAWYDAHQTGRAPYWRGN